MSRITFLTTLQHNPSIVLDAIKNGADFFIPPYNIGLINLPSGIVGTILSVVWPAAALHYYGQCNKICSFPSPLEQRGEQIIIIIDY